MELKLACGDDTCCCGGRLNRTIMELKYERAH